MGGGGRRLRGGGGWGGLLQRSAVVLSASTPKMSEGGARVLYIESIIILTLSAASCAWVMAAIISRKFSKGAGGGEVRRDRDIRKFLDFTVLILMMFELIQSLNWLIGTILSHYLFEIEPNAISEGTRGTLHLACKYVGFLTYFVDIVLYCWNACLAYSMYSWVVKKTLLRRLRVQMETLLVFVLLASFLVTLVPTIQNDFGALPGVVCWLHTLEFTSLSVVMNKLVILPLCWVFVGYAYAQTILYLRAHSHGVPIPVTKAYKRLRTRLLLFAIIFFLAWLLNSIWYFFLSVHLVHIALGVIGKCYYAMGLLDALAYGYGTGTKELKQRVSEFISTHAPGMGLAGGIHFPAEKAGVSEMSVQHSHDSQTSTCRMFFTSLNCGQCLRPRDLGRLDDWIPQYGYDLYVFAFQECRMLKKLRRVVYQHLGGPDEFVLFEQELGDAVMGNGKIALLVFARADDVASGVFRLAEAGKGRVSSGTNLGVSRFHNKGAVGLAFQYHGTAVAFITAHFASDSAGKRRLDRRNEDAWRTLHTLRLGGDVEEFDVHHQHHHVILLGDLNYRCDAFCDEVLGKLAASCERELQERGLLQSSGRAWRDDSYSRFFVEADRSRTGTTAGLSGPIHDDSKLSYSSHHSEEAGAGGGDDPKVANWGWVKAVDELSMSMARGVAFEGFKEGSIRFPPTFKMYPGRTIEDLTDVEDLRYGYQLAKGERVHGAPNREMRPPSWTDRILYHSLPDHQDRLVLEAYDTCDAITGSDHRPIVASFYMELQPVPDKGLSVLQVPRPSRLQALSSNLSRVGSGDRIQELGQKVTETSEEEEDDDEDAAETESVILQLAGQGEDFRPPRAPKAVLARPLEPNMTPPPCPSVHSNHRMNSQPLGVPLAGIRVLMVKMTDFVMANVEKASSVGGVPPAPPTLAGLSLGPGAGSRLSQRHASSSASFASSGREHASMPSSMCVSHADFAYQPGPWLPCTTISEDDVHQVVILLPIPPEDPLLTHRRVVLLERQGSQDGLAGPGGALGLTGGHREHVHRFAWSDVQRVGGLRLSATVQPASSLHAVIKFVDRNGVSLGEGVLSLLELLSPSGDQPALDRTNSVAGRRKRLPNSLVGRMIHSGGGPKVVTVQLSVGGVACGEVQFTLSVKRRARSGL